MPEITPIELAKEIILTSKTTQPSQQLTAKAVEATPPSPEPAKEEPKITAETSPQDSMRIAALIRKEKQLLKRSRELQEREKKIQEVQSKYEPWKEASEMATQNKLEAIKKLGITYDDLTQQVLNGGNLPPDIVATQKAVEAARHEIEEFKKQYVAEQQANQQQQYQSAIKQLDSDVQLLADNSEKFLLVKKTGAYHDVTEYIEKHFHETGRIIPVSEALEKVEAEIRAGFLEILNEENIKSALLPQQEQPKPEAILAPQTNQKITTLTHRATIAPPSAKPLTAAERRQRAIDAFYGKIA